MPVKPTPAVDRILARVTEDEKGCWIFGGALNERGYGIIQMGRGIGTARTHRVVYEAFLGPITEETLDHLCFTPACCNPGHLEPVSRRENQHRQWRAGRLRGGEYQKAKTHCPKGHPYAGDNLYRYNGRRHCRACAREKSARRRAEREH